MIRDNITTTSLIKHIMSFYAALRHLYLKQHLRNAFLTYTGQNKSKGQCNTDLKVNQVNVPALSKAQFI